MSRPAFAPLALAALLLASQTGCGWVGAARSRSPLGRDCWLGFENGDRLEEVQGTLHEMSVDWVVLREGDGTTVWIRRDRVVWMRVDPPR